MQFLNNESVFIWTLLTAGSLWANATQPGMFSQFLLLVSGLMTIWMVIRMNGWKS